MLIAEDILQVERNWIKIVQQQQLLAEIQAIKEIRTVNRGSKIEDLRPFLDEVRILTVGSRLQQQNSTEDVYPVILPNDHRFTELVVSNTHKRVLHAVVGNRLAPVRERVSIILGRQLVEKALRKYATRKRFILKAASAPSAPFPKDRIEQAATSEVTGLDFSESLHTKNQRKGKVQINIFTSAATRAINMELVSTMSTQEFIMAFRRFVSRRGLPRVVYSENALTFKAVARDHGNIWKVLKLQYVMNSTAHNHISWKSNAEYEVW